MNIIFTENKTINVSLFDLASGEFIKNCPFDTLAGTGLPPGYTETIYEPEKDKVGFFIDGKWFHVDDDRGQIFYSKRDAFEYLTTAIGEIPDPQQYTRIAPPQKIDGLLNIFTFDTKTQSWITGFDWYEKTIWNAQQVRSFCTSVFFVPNADFTNIAPPGDDFILNDEGEWIEPAPAPAPELILPIKSIEAIITEAVNAAFEKYLSDQPSS